MNEALLLPDVPELRRAPKRSGPARKFLVQINLTASVVRRNLGLPYCQTRQNYPAEPITMAPKKTARNIEIAKDPRKPPQWKVGKLIGRGACAEVYELNTIEGTPTEYAIKLAPVPTKTTKKGNSPDEVNDRLLDFERLLYQAQLPDLQGVNIPNLPSAKGPPASGTADGKTICTVVGNLCGFHHNLCNLHPCFVTPPRSIS